MEASEKRSLHPGRIGAPQHRSWVAVHILRPLGFERQGIGGAVMGGGERDIKEKCQYGVISSKEALISTPPKSGMPSTTSALFTHGASNSQRGPW